MTSFLATRWPRSAVLRFDSCPAPRRNIAPGSTRFRKGETLMKRLNESRLRKLEEATSGVARNVVIIAYGPGETAEGNAERHFARRPEDRDRPHSLHQYGRSAFGELAIGCPQLSIVIA